MMAQGMTKDFLKYMAEDSGNVALDGNFSVQVIERTFSQIFRGAQKTLIEPKLHIDAQ